MNGKGVIIGKLGVVTIGNTGNMGNVGGIVTGKAGNGAVDETLRETSGCDLVDRDFLDRVLLDRVVLDRVLLVPTSVLDAPAHDEFC